MLKFIGTGSAFNTDLGNTSAYIKQDKTLLLIDCGVTVFARAKKLGLFDDVENVYIIITHMHSDHVGSLADVIEYLTIIKGITPNIILPTDDSASKQEENIKVYLEKVGISEDDYEFTYCDMMEDVLSGLEKIEMPQVSHSKKITSYAVELYFTDKTIYYTGDQNDEKYVMKIAKKLTPKDLVYTDCTNKEYKGRIHISLNELEQIFAQDQRGQVTCIHLENYATIQEVKSRGFKTASSEVSKDELLKLIINRK